MRSIYPCFVHNPITDRNYTKPIANNYCGLSSMCANKVTWFWFLNSSLCGWFFCHCKVSSYFCYLRFYIPVTESHHRWKENLCLPWHALPHMITQRHIMKKIRFVICLACFNADKPCNNLPHVSSMLHCTFDLHKYIFDSTKEDSNR